MHKDFIVGKCLGRPPAFSHVQNVLNNMWSKGAQLEINLNPANRSMLVRIPNDFIRRKVLEKKVWHIGESMFHVYPWNTSCNSSLDLESIPIWAHLKGVPLDLTHEKELSIIAGLIREPKETDDFTLNLVSVSTAHVKVETDVTKPLPNEVELEREDGSVLTIGVDYPWLPPTCSHCIAIGHVQRYCPNLTPTWVPKKKKIRNKCTSCSSSS